MQKIPRNLEMHSKSKRAIKRPLSVTVEFAKDDGVMHTLEGDVSYRRGDALLTGLKGERWPIERSKFENSYFPEPNTEPGAPGKYRKKPLVVWVLMLEAPYSIEVGWKDDKIEGKEGDWLIQYDEDDFGIVESEVFKNSYEILT